MIFKKPKYYNESLSGYDYRRHLYRFRQYVKITKSKIRKKDKILDVGCQEGILLSILPQCNKYGIDIERKYLKLAKKRNPQANLKVAPAELLPFKDNSFDWVFCTEVIEHVYKPEKCLSEIRRVLKKNGHLLMSTYNHFYFFNLLTGQAFFKTPRFEDHKKEYNWINFKKFISMDFKILSKTQAASFGFLDSFSRKTKLPIGDFMIILARKI